MAKRIFTKVFSNVVEAQAGLAGPTNAIESWLAQEDIEVIGANLSVVCSVRSENDGDTWCVIELSQVGIFGQDGVILKAVADEGWNTSPAGIETAIGNVAVTFPAGYAIPVKEEGYLYINANWSGKSAGTSFYSYGGIIYYTKKGSR